MLAVNGYTQDYIDARRAAVAAQVAAYDGLTKGARRLAGDGGAAKLDGAIQAFERPFFNHMVVVLDASFIHRTRGREGKDGNPMNEVRLLSASILENDGVLLADKQIRLAPETSVLGYAAGDPIALSEEDFVRLAEGFFAGIEATFRAAD